MTRYISLRLINAPVPDGEIELGALAAISRSLQETAVRVARAGAGQEGPGRSFKAVEDASRLRLSGVTKGSTGLKVGFGTTGTLDVASPVEDRFANDFDQILDAAWSGTRPSWADDHIAESVVALVEALTAAAPTVEITTTTGHAKTMRTEDIARAPWKPADVTAPREVTVTGTLDLVDLRTHRFRLQDDVGNSIELRQVPDAPALKSLIGTRVRAVGLTTTDPRGRLSALESPLVTAQELPSAWTVTDAAAALVAELSKPGPDPLGSIDLTDDEFEAFLSAARG